VKGIASGDQTVDVFFDGNEFFLAETVFQEGFGDGG